VKDSHEVLRQKQEKCAHLGKQIGMRQQAGEKLREVAPLLAESDEEEDHVVLAEGDGRPDWRGTRRQGGRRKFQLDHQRN